MDRVTRPTIQRFGHNTLILPGLGNSGPDHWQSLWQIRYPGFQRVSQRDWHTPVLEDWISGLAESTATIDGSAILVAHSLACVLVAHATQQQWSSNIAAAFLVAPADVETAIDKPAELKTFTPIPTAPLPFPSFVVASANDPYMKIDRARMFAQRWGSGFIDAGAQGHINVASGHGEWPEGLDIFENFLSEMVEGRFEARIPRYGANFRALQKLGPVRRNSVI